MPSEWALDILYSSTESRAFTDKTIALLTDGQPNIVPNGGFEAAEYTESGGDTFVYDNAGADQYALYWANKAAEINCTIHTITVGQGANTTLMQEVADAAGGFYFRVDDPANSQQETQRHLHCHRQGQVG